jgi:hypothetical protein
MGSGVDIDNELLRSSDAEAPIEYDALTIGQV